MQTERNLLYSAWKKLIAAYLLSAAAGLIGGTLLIQLAGLPPEHIFEASTKRLSYAFPLFEAGSRYGLDLGVLLFLWNVTGALITISFVYTAAWFDPDRLDSSPRGLRKIFCGRKKMKLLCHLPGCAKIEAEPLRRLYVWLMAPMLGMMLLGIESGLLVSTTTFISGSFLAAVVSLLPHGLVEISTFTLAGAVPFSAHLCIRETAQRNLTRMVFQKLEAHRKAMPIQRIIWIVVAGLLLSGLVEAHITPYLMRLI
jgi:hypothetical protein